jgi:hypothetical protein
MLIISSDELISEVNGSGMWMRARAVRYGLGSESVVGRMLVDGQRTCKYGIDLLPGRRRL